MNDIDLRLCLTDAPVGNVPIKIRCPHPKHNDSKPSCAVYANGIHCFGCGLQLPSSNPEVFKLLMGRVPEDLEPYRVASRSVHLSMGTQNQDNDPLFYAIADTFHTFLVDGKRRPRLQWLYERGLTGTSIERFNLGHDGARFSIPIYNSKGLLVTIRYRRDDYYGMLDWKEDEIPKYNQHPGRDNSMHLYPEHLIYADPVFIGKDFVVVVEGEFDAMLLIQNGIPAITTTNGAGRIKHIPGILAANYPHIRRVYGATDMDLVGGQAEAELGAACLAVGLEYEGLRWSEEYKDVTELYRAGGRVVFLDGKPRVFTKGVEV